MIVTGLLFILYIKMKMPQNQFNGVKVKVLELSQRQKKFRMRKKGNTMRQRGKRQMQNRKKWRVRQPPAMYTREKKPEDFEFLLQLQNPSDPAHVKKYNVTYSVAVNGTSKYKKVSVMCNCDVLSKLLQ